jgi:hypothetical protein
MKLNGEIANILASKRGKLKFPVFIPLSSSSTDAKNIESFLREVISYAFDVDLSIEKSPKRKDYDRMSVHTDEGSRGLRI